VSQLYTDGSKGTLLLQMSYLLMFCHRSCCFRSIFQGRALS